MHFGQSQGSQASTQMPTKGGGVPLVTLVMPVVGFAAGADLQNVLRSLEYPATACG